MDQLTLWQRLRSENWFRHTLAFAGGILGIVIGLQLEGFISDSKDQERLEKFHVMVFNELKSNRTNFINSKLELDAAIELVKFMRSKHLSRSPLSCQSSALDSLIKTNSRVKSMVHVLETKGAQSIFEIQFTFSINPPSTNAWEALKVSGSLTEMDPELILSLSRTYDMISTNLNEKGSMAFFYEIEKYYSDRQFTDEELDGMLEDLEALSVEFEVKTANIQECLNFKAHAGVSIVYDTLVGANPTP